jgi:hypothetical protein
LSTPAADMQAVPVDRGEVQWAEVAAVYRRHHELSQGDRADRLRAEADFWWAWETVDDAVQNGSLPLAVVDALVRDPEGDSDYRGYVAAGVLEDLLTEHPESYAHAFAEKARSSGAWLEALRGVWLDLAEWTVLPEELRQLVPPPRATDPAPGG